MGQASSTLSKKKRSLMIRKVLAEEAVRNGSDTPPMAPDLHLCPEEAARDPDCDNPAFKFVPGIMSEGDRQEVIKYTRGGLGFDKTSKHFAYREKAIRYVLFCQGELKCLTQDYFNQPKNYNDFSGGLKRRYNLIPEHIVNGPLRDVLLKFLIYHKFPDRTVMLLQIQTTKPAVGAGFQDVTGQGIHSDGANRGLLLCFERREVEGAQNLFHGALDGSHPLCEPTTLEEGDGVFWKDNRVFHEVTDIKAADDAVAPARTLFLVHADAAFYMNGMINPWNTLKTNMSPVMLRDLGETLNSREQRDMFFNGEDGWDSDGVDEIHRYGRRMLKSAEGSAPAAGGQARKLSRERN